MLERRSHCAEVSGMAAAGSLHIGGLVGGLTTISANNTMLYQYLMTICRSPSRPTKKNSSICFYFDFLTDTLTSPLGEGEMCSQMFPPAERSLRLYQTASGAHV